MGSLTCGGEANPEASCNLWLHTSTRLGDAHSTKGAWRHAHTLPAKVIVSGRCTTAIMDSIHGGATTVMYLSPKTPNKSVRIGKLAVKVLTCKNK